MQKTAYVSWRLAELPRRAREIVGVRWDARLHESLRLEVADGSKDQPSVEISFSLVKAFQGIDEGYRLLDVPMGDALIYRTAESPYLEAFRRNASSTMDAVPLVHWLVVSCNQCVDVLSDNEPMIRVLNRVKDSPDSGRS